jgi:hypothetical protein
LSYLLGAPPAWAITEGDRGQASDEVPVLDPGW